MRSKTLVAAVITGEEDFYGTKERKVYFIKLTIFVLNAPKPAVEEISTLIARSCAGEFGQVEA